MLTRGQIISIDYNDNTCVVRMPLFETASTREPMTATATIAIPPGIFGGYKQNDVVIVGFNSGEYGDPVIVGKLFTGNTEENNCQGGAINCTNLNVSTGASIPADTKIKYSIDKSTIKNSEISMTSYNSIKEIADAVAKNTKNIAAISSGATSNFSNIEQVIGTWMNGKTLYQKTLYFNRGTTRLFITDINYDTIWFDPGLSFYVDYIRESEPVSNALLTSININGKYIDVPDLTSERGYGYITIKYTKVEK